MKYAIVVIAVVSALFCRAFLVSVYKVPTQTMAPTILAGDFLLASQITYGLRVPWSSEAPYFASAPVAGDLVVFIKDYRTYIKRVVAVEKNVFEYVNGRLSVNGQLCEYLAINSEADIPDGNAARFQEKCAHFAAHAVLMTSAESNSEIRGRVPAGKLLVVGDNRAQFENSDVAELIDIDQIIGSPAFIWMSYSSTQDFISEGLGIRWNRILTKVR